MDRLDGVWQALRPLGWEAELRAPAADPRLRRRAARPAESGRAGRDLGHPHLEALVRSVAYRQGSVPERTPAFAAVDLSLDRTFGRWQVGEGSEARPVVVGAGRDAGRPAGPAQGHVQLNTPVQRAGAARRAGRRGLGGRRAAPGRRRVVSTPTRGTPSPSCSPEGSPGRPGGGCARLRPALAPTVHHELIDQPSTGVSETMSLTAAGVPTLELPAAGRCADGAQRARLPAGAARDRRTVWPGHGRAQLAGPTADHHRGSGAVPGRAVVGRRVGNLGGDPVRRPRRVRGRPPARSRPERGDRGIFAAPS